MWHRRDGTIKLWDAKTDARLQTLNDKEDERYDDPVPLDFAILTMSHYKLIEKENAKMYRQKLNEVMKLEAFKDDE